MKNQYEVRGDTTAIFLTFQGRTFEALIDTSDLALADTFAGSWVPRQDSKTTGCFYVLGRAWRHGKIAELRLHRLLTDAPEGKVVDHINHDPLDNRRANLRVVTKRVNWLNRRLYSTNRSGVQGVCWDAKSQAWRARVLVDRRTIYDGRFASFDDAVAAREREYRQAFAAALAECEAS